MVTITNSALTTFRACPRKFYFLYVLKRKTRKESAALKFGTAMHLELEKVWQKVKPELPEPYNEEAAKIGALLEYYEIPDFESMDILGVEHIFKMGIEDEDGKPVSDYVYAGKIDVLFQDDEGLWVLDHKTTGKEIKEWGTYWQGLQVDAQMAWYCMAVKAVGFVYDVIHNPQIKIAAVDRKRAEEEKITPELAYQKRNCDRIEKDRAKHYQFRRFRKTEQMAAEAMKDLYQQTQALDYAYKNDSFYKNCNSCSGIYGTCPYLSVCTGLAEIGDNNFFTDKEFMHEELEM